MYYFWQNLSTKYLETKVKPYPGYSFNDTEIAFKSKSTADLRKARLLFSTFNYRWLLKVGPSLARFGLSAGLPVKGLIKKTIFAQFCGGESIEDCSGTIGRLYASGIGTILDYSVEGQESEAVFDETLAEIIRTVEEAAAQGSQKIPYAVFKVTGIGRQDILEKAAKGAAALSVDDLAEFERLRKRFFAILDKAAALNVAVLVDAEESWIQTVIDDLVEEAFRKYNREHTIVYNTLQMYCHDRLSFLKKSIQNALEEGYYPGFKVVRGAYMEKERKRAAAMKYPSPIQPDKAATDADYDKALRLCMEHLANVRLCAGTHNEESCMLLTGLMEEKGIAPSDKRVYFAQLLGMSDHISYNLSNAGYNVAKYVPYGPVKEVLPYLVRRAQENSSVKGQAGRELSLINQELERRKKA
jgi:proline dehydrogenase